MGFFGGLDQDTYDRQYSDRYLLGRIWSYFRVYKPRVIGLTLLGLLLAGLFALTPILVAAAVEALEMGASGLERIALLVVALFFTTLIQFGGNWGRRRLVNRVVGNVTANLRKDALAAAVARDMTFYDENKSGKVLSRITGDTEEFGQVILFSTEIVSQVVQALVLLVVLLERNALLTVIVLVFIPLLAWVTSLMRKWAREATRHGSRAMALVNDTIQETVSGISVAKNFRQEAMIYDEFVSVNAQSYTINLRRGMVLSLTFPVLNALSGLVIASALYAGAYAVVQGAISVSVWYLFMQAIDRFFFPIINLAAFWSQFQAGMSAAERVFALIDAENMVQQTDSQLAPRLKGRIEFEHVRFAYNPDAPVLDDFSLDIAPGENVAFVGHTGAGKSSIIKLLTRFYEFQGGQIRVDGKDIRTLELASYRSQVGLVPQVPFLFSGTVADNIRYARPDASDEEIMRMAMSIGDGEWLLTLPDGLDSQVGERGGRLSMGQRQLVALLRILIQKPAIFILDEATASVDPFTEYQIQQALDLILARSTSILIAHRLSTVRHANRIVVLKQGQIIEIGSHEQLIRAGGHYAELYNTYFRHQSLNYIEQARELLGEAAK